MTLKSDAKFEEKPICCFKNDKNFQVSKTYTLIGPFCAKYLTLDLKMYSGVIFHDTEESCKIEEKLTCGIPKNLHSKKSINKT